MGNEEKNNKNITIIICTLYIGYISSIHSAADAAHSLMDPPWIHSKDMAKLLLLSVFSTFLLVRRRLSVQFLGVFQVYTTTGAKEIITTFLIRNTQNTKCLFSCPGMEMLKVKFSYFKGLQLTSEWWKNPGHKGKSCSGIEIVYGFCLNVDTRHIL